VEGGGSEVVEEGRGWGEGGRKTPGRRPVESFDLIHIFRKSNINKRKRGQQIQMETLYSTVNNVPCKSCNENNTEGNSQRVGKNRNK
jgi:hypothetical protein